MADGNWRNATLQKLRNLLFPGANRTRQAWPMPRPDRPIAVIGDVHGCDALLNRLVDRLDAGFVHVFVGDLIDRGENSAAVLRRVMALDGTVCLIGNHEQMLLDFIHRPEECGPRWLRNGGLQTLASFGVSRLTPATSGPRLVEAAEALCEAMGREMLDWLQRLPRMYRSGNVAVVHAGADPGRSLDAQDPAHLIWGHPQFLRAERTDGVWVAHGHTIVDEARAEAGRISCDTGAYATGRLTAALIGDGAVRFVTA